MGKKSKGTAGKGSKKPKKGDKKLAKSKDPTYAQMAVYIPDELYRGVKIQLIKDGQRENLSDLTARLFRGWLESQPES